MFRYIELWFGLLTRCLQSHRSLLLENLALRQQLAVLKRKHSRPRMGAVDRIFWVFARRFWGAWKQSLVLVNPERVVGWHRAGFRRYWSWIWSFAIRPYAIGPPIFPEYRDIFLNQLAEPGEHRVHVVEDKAEPVFVFRSFLGITEAPIDYLRNSRMWSATTTGAPESSRSCTPS